MTRALTALIAICAVALTSASARAQDISELDALLGESVSTTASKSAQASTAVPALTVNLTAEDLRRYGIRTLAEAYNFLGLGVVSEDPLGEVEIGSRGVLLSNDAGKHILLLIDGHVTNDQRNGASYHTQSAGIPFELIDHIEIMLGPGSVLYGSNAMLGVVNVVTKRAKDHPGLQLIAEASLSPPLNQAHQPTPPALTSDYLHDIGTTYRIAAGGGRTFQLFGKSTEITGQLEYFGLKGPALGWTPITTGNFNYGPRAPIGIWGGTTRLSTYQQTPSGYLRIQRGDVQLTFHGLRSLTSAPYSRVQEPIRDFDDPASYDDRRYGAVDLSYNRAVSDQVSVLARVYGDAASQYSQIRTSTILSCPPTQVSGCTRTSSGNSEWAGTELQTTLRWLADRSMSSMLGVEGRVRRVSFGSGILDLPTGAAVATFGHYDDTDPSGAIYAQQIYNPRPTLALNLGARWDFDDQLNQRLSPRAAAAVEVWHGGTAKVIYSEAFRAPTPEEINLTNRYLVLAAPNLKPEIVRSAEASIQQRLGTQRMTLGVFASWWTDVVQRQRLTQAELSAGQRAGLLDSSTVTVYQFRNVARVNDYGLNASYEGTGRDGRLSFGANLTWAYARLQTSGGGFATVPVIPSLYGNARVSYDFGGGRPTVGFATQVSDKRLADYAHDPGVTGSPSAPPMLDARLTVSGSVPRVKALQYRLSVDYAVTTSNPFGAFAGGANENNTELVPINRLILLFGLQYDF